ncbi:MAG: MmgE/PrpD family protein [Phenylobacterium sp.]|jgi:2-methylcitrate dehydratase PrpD|uniref:MmgE/PrpD family protein n=1 Tax=Phenylobacterium sp. TaxID=1871053 RepID=UPI0025D99147|nr:MmgE/PrpD family protein [Phenylobacterium sp.]MCA3711226.1 MmgE/PrpD family protein [Phenylobacterium sp.]MCA3729318.1 MmgE/PrpD family protein [Phenylobacterium sp.]MCA3747054.1 MmgE/PrpD family protein [Phenylobacterium sp.]MCA3751985.1 MmgE/PrpD family protein [Phenylobacterium sp.]MCA6237269.1 MmgE/PrpD family protein [Phenylobacterium sp.]
MSGHLSSIAERLSVLLARPVSPDDRARARLHLLDWVGCTVAGARESDAERVRGLAQAEGTGACSIIGGARAGPQAAALANGPAGAILEMDDVDRRALLHPGPVVMPAALAAAEHLGVTSGDALLDAVVRGYEVMIRVGRAAGASHYRFFHPTGTVGGFGAAAAGASLMGLDNRRTAWALGLAGQQGAGLWRARHEPGSVKALHDGRAAANGVASALLARDGFRGPLRVLEGEQGFFPAMAPDADPEAVLTPADSWFIHEVSFKPHAACRHAHPTIDAALALRARIAGLPDTVRVETYRDSVLFCDKPAPTTVPEAKFSLQHSVAVALIRGDAGLDSFEPAALTDPEIAAMRARVSVAVADDLTATYPARFGARLIATAGAVEHRIEALDALGDPENPLSPGAVCDKARALMAWGGITPDAAERLIAAVLGLGVRTTVADLSAALPGRNA